MLHKLFVSLTLFFSLILCAQHVQGQSAQDLELAKYYLDNGEYRKAIIYYEKIYNQNQNTFVYQNYLRALLAEEQFDTAEKLIKQQIKTYPNNISLQVDLGQLYMDTGKEKKGKTIFDKLIKELEPNRSQIYALANAFSRINQTDYAIQAYENGQALLGDNFAFAYQIANLYGAKGDLMGMLNAYLNLLDNNPGYQTSIQNSLSRIINFEEDANNFDMLRRMVLERVQKSGGNPVFSELYIWLNLQVKDYQKAFVQTKALDLRFNEEGARLFELGKLAARNNAYPEAKKCFQEIINMGPLARYYQPALTENTLVNKESILNKAYTETDLQNLESEFNSVAAKIDMHPDNIRFYIEQADFLSEKRQKPLLAIELLDSVMLTPGISVQQRARIKLSLADALLYSGDIWEASLLYSQVDKDFKNDPLGHEAKLRNAKLSFFNGDFRWSQAQLDILKASTSKLIANDAMELSLFITDNLGRDSVEAPIRMYANAQLAQKQFQFEKANVILDSLKNLYTSHPIQDDVLLMRYHMAFEQKKWAEAELYLEEINTLYATEMLADKALFLQAELNKNYLNNPEKAASLYERIFLEHPGSLFVVDARKNYRALQKQNVIPQP